jgi:hypothetical protein
VCHRGGQLVGGCFRWTCRGWAWAVPAGTAHATIHVRVGKRDGLLAYDAIASVDNFSWVRVRRCLELSCLCCVVVRRAEPELGRYGCGFQGDWHCAEGLKSSA